MTIRASILLTAAALTLAACGNGDQARTTANADADLTAESIVANDVTAIDAVTAAAANMAADVDINFTDEFTGATEPGTNVQAPSARRRGPAAATQPRRSSPTAPAPAPAPAQEEPAANTTDNATE